MKSEELFKALLSNRLDATHIDPSDLSDIVAEFMLATNDKNSYFVKVDPREAKEIKVHDFSLKMTEVSYYSLYYLCTDIMRIRDYYMYGHVMEYLHYHSHWEVNIETKIPKP